MKNLLRKPELPLSPLRLLGAIASSLVCLLSVVQLAAGADDDAWRFAAVASFYAAFRLVLRNDQPAVAAARRRHSLQ